MTKTEARKLDGRIAVELFGWRWYARADVRGNELAELWPQDETGRGSRGPRLLGKTPGDVPLAYDWDRHWINRDIAEIVVPKFMTKPAADYDVLRRVRVAWDRDRRSRFVNALRALWQKRSGPDDELELRYEPGDYSRAALAVLDEGEPEPGDEDA